MAMADSRDMSIGEVINLLRDDFPDISVSKIRFLESQGRLVKLASDWWADAGAVERARADLTTAIARHGGADTGICKETLGVSRKYLIPVLEHFDRIGVTRREGNRRILVGGVS